MDKRDQMILAVASAAHEDWRAQYRAANGDKPRVKKTKDPAFNARGITEVDIASLSYEELPTDWQAENKAGAEVAVDCILVAVDQGRALDDNFIIEDFIEEAAAVQHEKWLERNGAWAPESQKLPYADLSEEEKEKDRFFVRCAIEAL
ncbi:MAG: hypothetical protein WC668_00925 [Patescibacteria group bacterium]|jgi:hypothetical protein